MPATEAKAGRLHQPGVLRRIAGRTSIAESAERQHGLIPRLGRQATEIANNALYSYFIGNKATDAHTDTWGIAEYGNLDLTVRQLLGRVINVGNTEPQPLQMDLHTLAKNYKAVFLPAFIVNPDPRGDFTPPDPETYLDKYKNYSEKFKSYVQSKHRFRDVRTKEDLIDVISRRRAVALMKSVEGIYVTDENYAHTIDTLWNDGVRSFGLKWNFDDNVGATTKAGIRNAVGAQDTGLGVTGRKVVEAIDNRGGIVDLAHASDQTIWDVLAIPSDKPRIDSHAGSREVVNQNRNITDEIAGLIINGGRFIKEGDNYRVLGVDEAAPESVAVHTVKGGGIVGMPFVKTFVGTNADGVPTMEQVVDHLVHFKEKGLLHGIVLGTDFNGIGEGEEIRGAETAEKFRENLILEMRKRGFTPKEIRGVLSETQLLFLLKNLPSKKDLLRPGEARTVYPGAAAA